MRDPLGINESHGMIRDLLGVARRVLVTAAVLGIAYGIGDFQFYGGSRAGARAGFRSFLLVLTVLGAPFFLIAGYAALRVRSSSSQALREARRFGVALRLLVPESWRALLSKRSVARERVASRRIHWCSLALRQKWLSVFRHSAVGDGFQR